MFVGVIFLFFLGYRFYGSYVARIFQINPQNKVPAKEKYDGLDYVPAKHWFILFGHHFASIAGAGPIVGPIFAYIYWGWLGAIIWIVLGSIFLGGVHDFSSLIISVREGGSSIGDIAKKAISKRTSILLLIFLWFALVVIIAVFASVCAKTFVSQPQVIFPSVGLIPVALIVGFLVYKLNVNVPFATFIGITILAGLIFLGNNYPLTFSAVNSYKTWIIILFVYAFFASIIPVDILLQPRDYISSFLLFFGIAVAFVGIIFVHYPLNSVHLFSLNSKAGAIFPVMFITIACGAISGFHSLVASGTTSKQLPSEKYAQRIGYGAMLTEGVLAAIALFAVAFGIKNVQPGVSPLELFSLGFAKITPFLGRYGKFIGIVIVNAFILTTLDTATRITRYITEELLKIKSMWLSTAIVIAFSAYLTFSGSWQSLWLLFGASNQLVAALALIVISCWLISKKFNYKISVWAAVFMLTVTLTALAMKFVDFIKQRNYTLAVVALILMVLGIWVSFDAKKAFQKLKVSNEKK